MAHRTAKLAVNTDSVGLSVTRCYTAWQPGMASVALPPPPPPPSGPLLASEEFTCDNRTFFLRFVANSLALAAHWFGIVDVPGGICVIGFTGLHTPSL